MKGVPASVAIFVPVLNEEAFVDVVTSSLQAQTYSATLTFYVIDGGSSDQTVALFESVRQKDPRFILLRNPRRVTPAALNIALREADAAGTEFVVRFDAHTRYPPDYVERAVRRLQQGEVVSVSGPQIAIPGDTDWSRASAVALSTRLGIGGSEYRLRGDREIEVDSGFCGIWRRELLVAAGGWDEETYPNEDAELAARLRKAGGLIVCLPELAAQYAPRPTCKGTALQYHRYGIFRARTVNRHPESLRLAHLIVPLTVVALFGNVVPARALRRLAHVTTAAYGLALAATTLAKAREAGRAAPLLPVVLVTMHTSWGTGFLRGCLRFGPPVRGIAMVVRRAVRGRGRGT